MNYEVIPLHVGNADYLWCVMEVPTEQLIKAYDFEEDANDYCEFLNTGGAFDGFTPSFVLREVAFTNINQEFTELLEMH
jgi:hypothetical protein